MLLESSQMEYAHKYAIINIKIKMQNCLKHLHSSVFVQHPWYKTFILKLLTIKDIKNKGISQI